MSQNSQDAIDVLSKVIVDTIDKKLDSASFDKSQTGVVTAVNGNTYTIAVFGSQYNITSDQIFTVGQSIVVTALQGDMKWLVCSPDNVGTMKTVDSKVKVVGDQLSSFIDKDFADTVDRIDQIKDQVDNSFMSWFYDGEPTSQNMPAKNWTTEDAKRLHIGDLYYDTTSGFSYEWLFKNNAYSWQKITNSGIQEALKNASKAQDTADGKRRVFYDTPSPPYDKGDMWTQGNGGDILICQVARVITDSYNRTDWAVASKYTDDTVANRAEEKADNAQSSADKANNDLATFKTEYDSDLKVTKEQIEARVTATTYSEDMSGLKERVSTAESKITQTEKDITLRATKEEAQDYATTAESNANKKLESYIKVANDKIESKVSKTDFNGKTVSSLINQDANSVKIKADKIELTGAVTIQNGKTVIDSDTINNSITEIDGSKITTGTIDAERLNLSGDITMGPNGKIVIGDNVITSDKIAQGTIFKLLWQNDSNAEFAPQDITLSGCAEYSQLLFVFNGYCKTDETKTSNPGEFDETTYIYKYTTRTSLVVPLTYNMRASALLESVYSVFISFPLAAFVNFITSNKNIYSFDLQSGSANSGYRLTTLKWSNSDLCISFDEAVVSTSGLFGSTKTRNDCVVPYQIYGIK
jgi:hypothetical protein|uniref:Putative tail protein n=1 Tax=Siphoviridae sp. ctGa111 TaxID=2825413 RepID=A0A8S5VDA3_9CAUD|nr:MAG TPA: putative tail protein [Siphoviridae sp. ctGa111]